MSVLKCGGAFLVLGIILLALSTDASSLSECAAQMDTPELDSASARTISGAVLDVRDFQVLLDSGQIVFFKPVRIDSTDLHYGAIFVGRGRLQFQPPLAMERQQLRRFLKTDSLNREFTSIVLLFDTVGYSGLMSSTRESVAVSDQVRSTRDDQFHNIEDVDDRFYLFQTLKSLLDPAEERFLVCFGDLPNTGVILCGQLPYEQEQVRFCKREVWLVYKHIYQTICSYPLEANELRGEYNGVARSPLKTVRYDIDARIKNDGKLVAASKATSIVAQQPTRILDFDLDAEMKVDSVLDGAGRQVTFARYKDREFYYGLWLLLDTPLQVGDSLPLTFYYSGDVAEKDLGQFYVFASSDWYPSHGFGQAATFDIRLKSPVGYTLIATAQLADSARIKDTLFTHWQVTSPASNVSFNLGLFERYSFAEPGQAPVDIYFNEDLHKMIGAGMSATTTVTGRHMERQVAGDVQNSVKLYEHLFGPFSFGRITISEIMSNTSEAFPGAVHLSYYTWLTTDHWGFDRMHRSHETAHQWWGANVKYATYHDQWLSEGFAEYCAFMYLQQAAGNDQFLDRLNDYRKDIIFDRETEGALALGSRAANIKNQDQGFTVLYQKGAFVVHMLRNLMIDLQTMKEDAFFGLMKEFYQTYQQKAPSTKDFKLLADKYAGQDMSWFFDEWVYNHYIPTYNCSYQAAQAEDGSCLLRIRIEQKDVPPSFKMYLPVEVELGNNRKAYLRYLVDKPVIEKELKLPAKPKAVHFNPFFSVLADVNQ